MASDPRLYKEQYGAGSVDECLAKAAAIKAMHSLTGWDVGETHHFYTQFQLDSYEDLFSNMLPNFQR